MKTAFICAVAALLVVTALARRPKRGE